MNTMNVVSAECAHYVCSACRFEDCACFCHTDHDCDEDTCVCANIFEDDPTDMRGPGNGGYTDEVIAVEKTSNTGVVYSAAQLIMHSSERLHHPPDDDDRTAITFWLPKSAIRRESMARSFEEIARIFRTAKSETGLD